VSKLYILQKLSEQGSRKYTRFYNFQFPTLTLNAEKLTTPRNGRKEVMHQTKQTSKADFRLKL